MTSVEFTAGVGTLDVLVLGDGPFVVGLNATDSAALGWVYFAYSNPDEAAKIAAAAPDAGFQSRAGVRIPPVAQRHVPSTGHTVLDASLYLRTNR